MEYRYHCVFTVSWKVAADIALLTLPHPLLHYLLLP